MTLRACCEDMDSKEIPLILEAAEIKLYKQCINLTYDSRGKSYEIPNYCINLPYIYDIDTNKDVKINSSYKKIILKIRFFNNHFEINSLDNEKVSCLKEKISIFYNDKFKDCEVNKENIRLFYNGKELKNDVELLNCNITDNCIILMNLIQK